MMLVTMDADDVNYALKKKGWTQAAVSRALAVDISTVNNVIHSRTTSSRIAEFIAEQLGKSANQVWPGRYSEVTNNLTHNNKNLEGQKQ